MRQYIEERVKTIAQYLLKNGGTVRSCALRFGVSKTTVHKDLRERLPEVSAPLAEAVGGLLQTNKEERHLRGGEATRSKYAQLPKQEKCDTI